MRLRNFLQHSIKGQSYAAVFLVFSFLLYALPKWWLLFRYGDLAFGYDTGIYRHIIDGYAARAFDTTLPPFGFTSFSTPLKWLGVSTDYIMFGWYSIFSLLIFATWYIVVRNETNKKTALIALFLFAISVTQMEFYAWYYYRQYMALWFVLISMILFQKRSNLLPIPLILIGIIHPISLLPLVGVYICFCMIYKEEQAYLLRSLGIGIASVILMNGFEIYGYAKTAYLQLFGSEASRILQPSEATGQFISFADYVREFGVLYIPISLYGIYSSAKKYPFFFIFLIFQLCFAVFGLFFQNRYVVYADLGVLFFAALALSTVWEQVTKRAAIILAAAVILFYCANGIYYVQRYRPHIAEEDFAEIVAAGELPKGSLIMTVSSQYAPWLYGYTDHTIIAPGMFEANRWNRDEWEIFWSTTEEAERYSLLSRYGGSHLFIYIGSIDQDIAALLSHDAHAEQLTSHIWKYTF